MYLTLAPALLASASPVILSDVPVLSVAQAAQIAGEVQAAPPALPELKDANAQPQAGDLAQAAEPAPLDPGNTIIVDANAPAPPGDPLENVNIETYEVIQKIDQAVIGPVAGVYEDDLPKPLRNGLRNFLRNLMEPVNFLNFMLQLKPGKAMETLGRFAINTTIGIGGLFDIAAQEEFNLPYRRNGLSNTLGYYGVGQGPFLVLPLIGATTLRDLIGSTVDQAIVPFAVGAPLNTPYYAIPAYTVNSLQYRMEFDDRITEINDSVDPYYAMRENYLCRREAEIAALRNRPPPRDCSIEALMADPAPVAAVVLPAEPVTEAVASPPQPPAEAGLPPQAD
jgi:phospholipid-binding lipoprotein MlaA